MGHGTCCSKLVPFALSVVTAVVPLRVSAIEDNPGAWITFSISDAFRSDAGETHWHYWFDTQARFFDPGSGVTQFVWRPAVGYRITDNMKGWFGYARVRSRNRAGTSVDENRYWQQLDWPAGRFVGGQVSMRARLEQRSVSISDDVGVTLRFQTKYVRPVGINERTSLIIGIEPFVHLRDTDWQNKSGLAQNRLFIGLGWQLRRSISLEAGYMNQYFWRDGGEDQSFHHGILNFNVRF